MSYNILFTIFFLFLTLSLAEYQVYNEKLTSGFPQYRTVNLFYDPDKESNIDFSLTFTIPEKYTGTDPIFIQIVVVQGEDSLKRIGVSTDKSESSILCCTTQLMEEGISGCNILGGLILPPDLINSYWYKNVNFTNSDSLSSFFKDTYHVKATDKHYIVLADCFAAIPSAEVSGQIAIKNPYGFLPGEQYGYLPFYQVIVGVLVIIYIFWGILNFYHRKTLLQIQHVISFVVFFTIIEMGVWLYKYYSYNEKGFDNTASWVVCIIFEVIRKTTCRMLVVAVSMGYGVVKPHLERISIIKIILLGIVYCAADFLFEMVRVFGPTQEESGMLNILVILPVCLLDGYWYFWIFTRLNEQLRELISQKQIAKLRLYQYFSRTLVFSLLVSIVFGAYEIYFVVYIADWTINWLLDRGFWTIIYLVILLVIMYLWRPSSHSKDYAYSTQLADEEEVDNFELGSLPPVDSIDNHNKSSEQLFSIGDADEDPL